MSQEEEYEEDFAAKYDGVFAGEADGDDDESEGDEEDYGDEFEGAEPAMPDPRAEDGSMGSGRPGAARCPCCRRRRPRGADDGSICLLYTSPSPRDGLLSRMPSSA